MVIKLRVIGLAKLNTTLLPDASNHLPHVRQLIATNGILSKLGQEHLNRSLVFDTVLSGRKALGHIFVGEQNIRPKAGQGISRTPVAKTNTKATSSF